jgi:hypothetical protein
MATEDKSLDQIVNDAQSFQHLLDIAKTADPVFAGVLLGNAVSTGKTNLGSVIVGGIALLSTRYGFGWTDSTCEIAGGLCLIVANVSFHWLQVLSYRKKLPIQSNPSVTTPVIIPTSPTTSVQGSIGSPGIVGEEGPTGISSANTAQGASTLTGS